MEDKTNSSQNIFELISETSLESLHTTDYIFTALNDIQSYEYFLQYKPQIQLAMKDIKDSLQYIYELSNKQQNNQQNKMIGTIQQENKNQIEFTSKSLGLRYNYDPYLTKMFPVNNNSYNIDNTNNNTGLAYEYDLSNKSSNYKYPPKNEQINTFDNNYKSNSYFTQTSHLPSSITNKFNYNNKSNVILNENKVNPINQPQINENILQKNQTQFIQPSHQNMPHSKKKKVSRVTDLVMKINSDQELYDLTIQLFGDDILDKLMSPNVEIPFIENIEKTIDEIERLRANDTDELNNNNDNNPLNDNKPQPIQIKNSLRNQISKTQKKENTSNTKQIQDEETTQAYVDELLVKSGLLGKYPKTPQGFDSNFPIQNDIVQSKSKKHIKRSNFRGNNSRSNSEIYNHPKIFMNYMSQYGQYFDSSLQHGGMSKLPPSNKTKKIRIISPVRCNKLTEVRVSHQGTPKPDVSISKTNSIYRIRSAAFSPNEATQQNPPLSSKPPLCHLHSTSSHNIISHTDNPTTTNPCNTNPQKTVEYVETIAASNCERILTHLLKNNTKKNLSITPHKCINKVGCVNNNNKESSTKEESDFVMPTKVQDYPQLNLEHAITPEEEENIKHALQNYVLFQGLNQEVLSTLLHELFYFTFDKNKIIYEQGDEGNFFYILADGQVKAESKPDLTKQNNNNNNISTSNQNINDNYNNNLIIFNDCSKNTIKTLTTPTSKVYSQWECFGGLSLISKCKREETLTSVTEVAIFCLDGEAFREIIRRLNELRLRDRFNYLNTISLFQPLGNIPKYNVATKLQTKQYKPNEKIIVYGTIGESLFTIKSGIVSCRIGLKEVRQLGTSDYFGQNAILVDMKRSCDVVALTDTICYEISRNDLKDALGDDYRDVILLSFFTACVNTNKYFKDIFIESKMNALFALFKVHRYTYKERLVDNKVFTSNNRLVLIIDGSIYKEKEQESGYELYAKKGDIIGESQIKLIENTLSPFLLAYPDCITFEAHVEDVCKLLDIIQQPLLIATKASLIEQDNAKDQLDFIGRISKLKKVGLFQNLSEKTLETIAKAMKTKKFILNDIIVEEGTVGDSFYLISQGRVRVTSQGKTLRDLDEGNYFGEVALLDPNEKRTASIIAIDETVILYEISKNEFDLLIVDNNIKTHMKTKLALQITSIELNDLFYIKFLGKGKFGNVNLVHNTKHIYAIKAVSRREVEKQNLLAKYFLNERRVMLALDHPFIIKLVKTLKNDLFCFFLLEYVNGINLDEYVSSTTKKRNVYTTQFYIGSMLIMLEYLQNKMIAHRDIKPSNMMVNSNGYLKMIDFGTAKVLNDYTNTVIGTPHYISPEILQGKGYSLSCDFWSVGVCMYEIFYGTYPFGHYANDVIEIYKEILHKDLVFPSEEARYDKVNSFIKDVLKKKVNLRICSVNLLKGKPFFEGFEWDKLIEFKLQPPYVPEVQNMDGVLNDKHKPFTVHLQEETAKMKDKDKRCHYHDKWADEF